MSKRSRSDSDSYDPRESVKRSNLDYDSPSKPEEEEVARLCREAGENQMHLRLRDLIRSNASSEKIQACYSPLFTQLAKAVAGRDDLPVPPIIPYVSDFSFACDPQALELEQIPMIKRLISYIKTEGQKLRDKEEKKISNSLPPRWGEAVRAAWQTNYVGDAHNLLHKAIRDMHRASNGYAYGNFCAIIQGSGTGKSRLVDKLAESVFTIPITLRPDDDEKGFPFGDLAGGEPLVKFFCNEKLGPAFFAQRLFLKFLLKTIAYADKWIDAQLALGTKNLAAEWRKHLELPQSAKRLEMFTEAIDSSPLKEFPKILTEPPPSDSASPDLRAQVTEYVDKVTNKLKPQEKEGKEGPVLLFYFDEAHHLTKTTVTGQNFPQRTAYQCLCKALTYMVNTQVFVLFLSTYSRLSEFAPSARNFWSDRPSDAPPTIDKMNPPFVELPFDAWKGKKIVTEGRHSIEQICSLKFKARFGRPMFWTLYEKKLTDLEVIKFAMSKLVLHFEDPIRNQADNYPDKELIPLLAARIDLTFESNRDEAVLLEGLLVASSLRTVYSVPQHRQYLRGGYSSEPFVAEAAAQAMFKHFRSKLTLGKRKAKDIDKIIESYKNVIPNALDNWLSNGLISKGTRGELVVRTLLTVAHDIAIMRNPSFVKDYCSNADNVSFRRMVPVVDFLRALILEDHIDKVLKSKPANMSGKTLEEAFKDGFVHFTQFVQADDLSTITDEASFLLFTRDAAIQGFMNMIDADLGIPVWLRCNRNPDRWCMTSIFFQIKDKLRKQFILIDAQKAFNFFTSSTIPAEMGRPYITIAMELGVLVPEKKKEPQPKLARGRKKGKGKQPAIPTPAPSTTRPAQQRSLSLNEVFTISRERETLERVSKNNDTHPRYEIIIRGCSNEVYNAIGDYSYSALLAHKDLLEEHPRGDAEYIDAILQLKPYWRKKSSYHWAKVMKESRLDVDVEVPPKDWEMVGGDVSDACEDDDDEMVQESADGVVVGGQDSVEDNDVVSMTP